MPGGTPTADAAVRLVRLEVALNLQAEAAAATARQLDKLQARLRLATGDLKSPLRQVQEAAGAQAEALGKLAEAQRRMGKQVEGAEEVIGALQAVGARQFKVRAAWGEGAWGAGRMGWGWGRCTRDAQRYTGTRPGQAPLDCSHAHSRAHSPPVLTRFAAPTNPRRSPAGERRRDHGAQAGAGGGRCGAGGAAAGARAPAAGGCGRGGRGPAAGGRQQRRRLCACSGQRRSRVSSRSGSGT